MNTENIQKTNHHEEPLFVLKYSWWRILWRLFCPYLLGAFIFGGMFFYARISFNYNIMLLNCIKLFFIIVFCILGPYVIFDMLMMKEVYLYADRVIKRYRWGKENLVFFSRAKYHARESMVLRLIAFYDEKDDFILIRSLKGVVIDGSLVSYKDFKIFKEILSRHTGRSVQELEWQLSPTKLLRD